MLLVKIMAAMQSLLRVDGFSQVTLSTWRVFITELAFQDVGPYIGATSAAFVRCWDGFDAPSREIATGILNYLVLENSDNIRDYLADIVSLSAIRDLAAPAARLEHLMRGDSITEKLNRILNRCMNDNATVAALALSELKEFLNSHHKSVEKWASGDVFNPEIPSIVYVLLSTSSRDGDAYQEVRLTAYECLGLLGALDPDRFEPRTDEEPVTILSNFHDEAEAVQFALHVIRHLLVGAFRSTSDLRYQSHLAYAIQELLKFCKFTPDLVKTTSPNAVPIKTRNRWESLPKYLLDTITPLLEGRFSHDMKSTLKYNHPFYTSTSSYRDWVQLFASFLITRTAGHPSSPIFSSFQLAVRSQDAEVARYLLPHLVLSVLISGTPEDQQTICSEIVAVLEAQTDADQDDKRLLSAQVRRVFTSRSVDNLALLGFNPDNIRGTRSLEYIYPHVPTTPDKAAPVGRSAQSPRLDYGRV